MTDPKCLCRHFMSNHAGGIGECLIAGCDCPVALPATDEGDDHSRRFESTDVPAVKATMTAPRTLASYLRHDDDCNVVSWEARKRAGAQPRYPRSVCSCGLDAALQRDAALVQGEKNDQGAGLIGQTIPDMAGTEPRLRQKVNGRCPDDGDHCFEVACDDGCQEDVVTPQTREDANAGLIKRLRELRWHVGTERGKMTTLYGDTTLLEISNLLAEAADALEVGSATEAAAAERAVATSRSASAEEHSSPASPERLTPEVESAREVLTDSIEQVTHQITLPGEIEQIQAAIDALIQSVQQAQQDEIQRLGREKNRLEESEVRLIERADALAAQLAQIKEQVDSALCSAMNEMLPDFHFARMTVRDRVQRLFDHPNDSVSPDGDSRT